MTDNFRKAGRIFNRFLKLTLGNYMRHLFGYKILNKQIAGLKPPFIVIANHTNFYDPFLLSMCISHPVHFITSDAYFRSPALKFLLSYVGAIPKTKFVSDPLSIKYILSVVKNNGVIGIFAEGRRNWDGSTLPLLYPTAKLVKSLKIPVVSVLFQGACLSMPRWTKSTRKGKLTMTCSQLLSGEEIHELSVDEIYARMTAGIAHDEYAWQRGAMVPYKGKRLAERLELFLFLCPECKSDKHMKSSDDIFFCKNCGYTVRYDEYGFFKPVSCELRHESPRDWNLWQLDVLEKEMLAGNVAQGEGPMLEDNDVIAYKGGKSSPLAIFDKGILQLHKGSIVFDGAESGRHSFGISEISGQNIQYNDHVEFYHGKVLYRFGGSHEAISAYKWVRALEILKTDNRN